MNKIALTTLVASVSMIAGLSTAPVAAVAVVTYLGLSHYGI